MTNTKKEIYKVLKPHTQNMSDKEINHAIDKLIYLFKNKKKTWHSRTIRVWYNYKSKGKKMSIHWKVQAQMEDDYTVAYEKHLQEQLKKFKDVAQAELEAMVLASREVEENV